MISLETAKKLKAAGLEWEPQYGDRFIIPEIFIEGLSGLMDDRLLMAYRANELEDNWDEFIRVNIWLPRLDQILALIEKQGYIWELRYYGKPVKYQIRVDYVNTGGLDYREFTADSPDEAAAQALLWILTEGNA